METNHTDLRVIKTKRGLRAAFIQLLLEKDYDAISIQEIATAAESARITFYRHYKNKEELLVDCLTETFVELKERVEHGPEGDYAQGYSPLQILYEHIHDEETLYRILFSSRGTQEVVSQVRTLLANRIKQVIKERFPADQLQAPLEIIAYHVASAQLGLAAWWLENDKPYTADYMAHISFWLSMAGTLRGCGVWDYQGVKPLPPERMQVG
jgi:AcrR family transcriptional regulator